jgi:hypothetical protein
MTESTSAESDVTNAAGANGATPGRAVAETVEKANTTKSPSLSSELLYADAGNVEATNVTMQHSGAEHVTAERATVEHSDIKSLDARSVQLTRSGSLSVKAENAVLQNSSAAFIQADDARLVKSRAVVIYAGRLTAEGNVKTFLHFGPVDGEIRTIFTPQSAVGFGAAVGFVVLIIGGIFRRMFGHTS